MTSPVRNHPRQRQDRSGGPRDRAWLGGLCRRPHRRVRRGRRAAGGEDAAGDLIMPGLIELHTDHLEAHYVPRPKVFWDPIAAVVSYDGQLATCGHHHGARFAAGLARGRRRGGRWPGRRAGRGDLAARESDLLRADHFLHLRCEIPMPSVVEEAEELIGRPDVRLMSLMDHTPGQRQFRDEVKLRDYYRGKGAGMTDAELECCSQGVLPIRKLCRDQHARDRGAGAQVRHPAGQPRRHHRRKRQRRHQGSRFGRGIPDHDGGRAACTRPASAF